MSKDQYPLAEEYKESQRLLAAIHEMNQVELYTSTFAAHFFEAFEKPPRIHPEHRLIVKQKGSDYTQVWAVLRQPDQNGVLQSYPVIVGEQVEGDFWVAHQPFDNDDLELAKRQLKNLEVMKSLGMISLDDSLSYPLPSPKKDH
jgi:hypothetical protein